MLTVQAVIFTSAYIGFSTTFSFTASSGGASALTVSAGYKSIGVVYEYDMTNESTVTVGYEPRLGYEGWEAICFQAAILV